ncbi:hypothetical protein LMG18095_04215 [Ralstonia thomasii]|jgi:hypothetical protein|uniref:Uncharacterized protein n=1 Tax=Ralstonia thomasii TaxID=3058596 RepID=A0ABN9JB73_9RALS|nr:hypothetical protein LMG18095_04215 [Ralstonia sp. LMG 18095]
MSIKRALETSAQLAEGDAHLAYRFSRHRAGWLQPITTNGRIPVTGGNAHLSTVRFDAHLRIRIALNFKHLHRKLKLHAGRRAALRLQDRQHTCRQFAPGVERSPAQDREISVYECARRAGGTHGKRVAPVASAFDVGLNKMPGRGKGCIDGEQSRFGVKGVEVGGVFKCEMGHGAAVLQSGCWESPAQIVMQPAAPGPTPISTVGDSENGHLAKRFAPAGISNREGYALSSAAFRLHLGLRAEVRCEEHQPSQHNLAIW